MQIVFFPALIPYAGVPRLALDADFTTGMGAIQVSCFPLFSHDMMEAHVGLALNAKMHWAF